MDGVQPVPSLYLVTYSSCQKYLTATTMLCTRSTQLKARRKNVDNGAAVFMARNEKLTPLVVGVCVQQ